MRIVAVLAIAAGLLLCGCPLAPDHTGGDSVVSVVIGANVTRGPAPLRISFAGDASSSPNGGPYRYRWDFGDGSTSSEGRVSHTFDAPGLYTVKLTVTDALGETGINSVDVRVQGQGATAVIQSNINSGPAPLLVRFDGTGSSAPDDSIRDYFWDFGNGQTSRLPNPVQSFSAPGSYSVVLRVVTGGGVEAATAVTIEVGGGSASLDFQADDFATLPVPGGGVLSMLTVEAWFKATVGGTFLDFGNGALRLSVSPSAGSVTVRIADQTLEAPSENLTNVWRHVAVSYDSEEGGTLYLDGIEVGTIMAEGPVSVASLRLGPNYVGRLSEIRLWSTLRNSQEIVSTRNRRLGGREALLTAYWPLDEGSGQVVLDRVIFVSGFRGTTINEEPVDPAWSTDSPPLSN